MIYVNALHLIATVWVTAVNVVKFTALNVARMNYRNVITVIGVEIFALSALLASSNAHRAIASQKIITAKNVFGE